LVEYHTALDARVGYPTEHLAKDTKEELKNPMYATGIGLIIKGIEEANEQGLVELNLRKDTMVKEIIQPIIFEQPKEIIETDKQEFVEVETEQEIVHEVQPQIVQPSFRIDKPKENSWMKGLLISMKDWFEDDSVNKDFE